MHADHDACVLTAPQEGVREGSFADAEALGILGYRPRVLALRWLLSRVPPLSNPHMAEPRSALQNDDGEVRICIMESDEVGPSIRDHPGPRIQCINMVRFRPEKATWLAKQAWTTQVDTLPPPGSRDGGGINCVPFSFLSRRPAIHI